MLDEFLKEYFAGRLTMRPVTHCWCGQYVTIEKNDTFSCNKCGAKSTYTFIPKTAEWRWVRDEQVLKVDEKGK